MVNNLFLLAKIILILITLASAVFSVYLHVRLRALKKAKRSQLILSITYEIDVEHGTEVTYNPQMVYKPKKANLGRNNVHHTGLIYAIEIPYSTFPSPC